jgi:hypothetical protein
VHARFVRRPRAERRGEHIGLATRH